MFASPSVMRAWSVFLLGDEERRAAERTGTQQADIAALHRGAGSRARVADRLEEPVDDVAAFVLYREAAVLYVAAYAKSKDPQAKPPNNPPEAWQLLQSLLQTDLEAPPTSFDELGTILTQDDLMALDRQGAEALRRQRPAIQDAVAWLARRVDPRSARTLRATRISRIAGLAIAIALGLLLTVRAIFAPTNLARGKPAFASSHRPGTPSAGGVDNGEIESAFGVHTNVENDAWVMIDLGRSYAIHEVRVYNRADGWTDAIVPLVLQFSEDGQHWTEIERRLKPFGQSDPWVASPGGAKARYVRTWKPDYGCVVLSEIEVF